MDTGVCFSIQNRKRIFKVLHQTIGMTPKVMKYYSDDNKVDIDMYIGIDRPDVGITTYSTIGLSDYPIGLSSKEGKSIRVEFISVCKSESAFFGNVLASCAFKIIDEKFSCKPGIVYPNVIDSYYEDIEMKHIYFTSPFEWSGLQRLDDNDKTIVWLFAIPISDKEFNYLHEHGFEEFEDLLEVHDIQYFDLNQNQLFNSEGI